MRNLLHLRRYKGITDSISTPQSSTKYRLISNYPYRGYGEDVSNPETSPPVRTAVNLCTSDFNTEQRWKNTGEQIYPVSLQFRVCLLNLIFRVKYGTQPIGFELAMLDVQKCYINGARFRRRNVTAETRTKL